MSEKILVTRAEFDQGMGEQVENIKDVMNVVNSLKNAVNAQAEAIGLNRYIIARFVPEALLEQATKDYKREREAMIAAEAELASGKGN